MERLRELISNVKFAQGHSEPESHKTIYTYIQDHALANTPKRTIPPVDVIIYAARNILYPSFLYSDIPELLDLLSIVEFYRLRVIEVARNASLWNNYYKTSKETDRDILTREEEKILKRLTKESRIQAQRYVYRTLISQCCQLDIYHLWSGQYPSIPVRLHDYFAPEVQQDTSRKPKLFRYDLSDKEQEDLRATGQACLQFWRDAMAWLDERVAIFQARGLSDDDALGESELFSHKRDFTSAFPNPVQKTILKESIEWYLVKVQKDADTLKMIFPT